MSIMAFVTDPVPVPVRSILTYLDLPELCSWLDGLLAGLTSADLVRLLLDADPVLQRCEPIVRCLLAAPHSVRRPADVARAVGMSDLRVRAQAREAGFSRVDHLLTHLRLRAGQLLRERTDWPRHRIDQVLGIRDRSNFRRQAARVCRMAPVP